LECKHRFTTYERVEFVPITVIKADGKKESFDPSKLLRGMVRACEKTGLSYQRLERIVEDIEAQIQQSNNREISSQDIGQLVLKYLQKENEVAYIRFASVYGRFQGITDFMDTLEKMKLQAVGKDSGGKDSLSKDNPDDWSLPPLEASDRETVSSTSRSV
jgi:transcriptional repressor NrdR